MAEIWIAVAIGMVAAITIWSRPVFETIWIVVGALTSAALSGLLQGVFAPKTTIVRKCYENCFPRCTEISVQKRSEPTSWGSGLTRSPACSQTSSRP